MAQLQPAPAVCLLLNNHHSCSHPATQQQLSCPRRLSSGDLPRLVGNMSRKIGEDLLPGLLTVECCDPASHTQQVLQ
jgi:hypothetical protein